MTEAPPEFHPSCLPITGRPPCLKGASAPPTPPASPAPARADVDADNDAGRRAKRRNGLQDTILGSGTEDETLGRKTFLGAGTPGATPMYGGEI